MTNEEKRMMIVEAVHALVEAERSEMYAQECCGREKWEKTAAEVKRANEAFSAACDAAFGVAE